MWANVVSTLFLGLYPVWSVGSRLDIAVSVVGSHWGILVSVWGAGKSPRCEAASDSQEIDDEASASKS